MPYRSFNYTLPNIEQYSVFRSLYIKSNIYYQYKIKQCFKQLTINLISFGLYKKIKQRSKQISFLLINKIPHIHFFNKDGESYWANHKSKLPEKYDYTKYQDICQPEKCRCGKRRLIID